ncbi:hypothetical protein ACFSKS_14580 [Pseudocitrobacter faecalis]
MRKRKADAPQAIQRFDGWRIGVVNIDQQLHAGGFGKQVQRIIQR